MNTRLRIRGRDNRSKHPAALLAAWLTLAPAACAALVGPSGYTNDFSARPSAPDFSTSGGIAGGAGTITTPAAMDALVSAVSAGAITVELTDSSPGDPPTRQAAAQWTSGGSAYVITRPTGNAATVLVARLVNDTSTNCNALHLEYQLTVGAAVPEEVPGQRLYYSLSPDPNGWVSLPAVSGRNASGLVSTNVILGQPWTHGGTLYLLWADDNAASSTEGTYQIDGFFAAAYHTNLPLTVALTSPLDGQHFGLGEPVVASVALTGSPANVGYYVDGSLAMERDAPPFSPVTLAPQALGAHTVHATARETSGSSASSGTNTFVVDVSLGGTLASNTILTAAGSPYTVGSPLIVPGGITLALEPGVTVRLRKNCGITVHGRLLADGTTNQPILFTRYPGDLNWERLLFVEAADSLLRHCTIEYANSAGDHKDAYYATNCDYPMNVAPRTYFEAVVALACHLDLEGCTFTNLFNATGTLPEGDAIGIFSDDPVHRGPASANVRRCRFLGIGQGVHTRYAHALVEHCYFVGKTGDNDDVELHGESSLFGLPNPVVRYNVFDVPASDDRIHPTRCSALIYGNTILGSTDHAIVLRDACCPIVFDNLFYAINSSYRFPGGGIAIQNGCDALIVNNTFIGINSAIKLFDHQSRINYPYCLSTLSGRATVINCIIWGGNNAIDVSGSAGAPFQEFRVNVSHCDIQGGTNSIYTGSNTRYQVTWGPGNLSTDPLFANAASRDYSLSSNSPCIDAAVSPGTVVTTNTHFLDASRARYAVTNDLDAIVTADFARVPRPLDGQGGGTPRWDMGAYERMLPGADSNADGVPDGWTWQYGLSPAAPDVASGDPDQDGMNTGEEYVADTDPTNSLSRFDIEPSLRGSTAAASFLSSGDRLYTLFLSTNLAENRWTPVPGQATVPGTGERMSLADSNSIPARFLRVRVQIP